MSSFPSQTPRSLTDSEWENIRLKNLEIDASLNFVPVPQNDNLTTLIADELAKIDHLSEEQVEKMVENELESHSCAEINSLPLSESLENVLEEDCSALKRSKASEKSISDLDVSQEGSATEPEDDFDDYPAENLVQSVMSQPHVCSPSLPSDETPHTSTGTDIISPFALAIPPALAAKVASGKYKLILEPVTSSNSAAPLSFVYKAIPITETITEAPAITPTNVTDNNVQVPTDVPTDTEQTESEEEKVQTPVQKTGPTKRGAGSSHKSGNLKSYSLWMRMGIAKDIRIGKMNIKEALLKWDAPRRRVNEWLREYDAGAYSDLPDFYTQEELKKMKKLPGGGRPLKDPQLEQKLINYYNELKEELYPISSKLLTYKCLAHNENFLGGPESPNFKMRIADFLKNWRRRNLKGLRKPTSTGQKLPDGYTGKWEAASYYFYLETKGYDPKWVYQGDETNLPDEEVPSRVYADLGVKRVPVRTSGQDKDNKTAFLVQNTYGEKLPLFPILRGDTQANRPGFHTKKNNSTIRQRFQAKINEFAADRKKRKLWRNLHFWVNDTSYMDEEAFLHFGQTVWKYRAGTSGEEQPPSILLLDDLTSHKTKRVLDEFKTLYNTKIIILPGGLTPKAQIMDVTNNRPFKVSVRSKQLKLRMAKYKHAKSLAATNPLVKVACGIPTLTREECVQIMLEAWAELNPELGAKAWVTVKLMPYELAQKVGWTPKEAFADIRQFDHPWQACSKIKPVEVDGEDLDAIEWDNVSLDFYISKNYVEVLQQFPSTDSTDEKEEDTETSTEHSSDIQTKILQIARNELHLSTPESPTQEPSFEEESLPLSAQSPGETASSYFAPVQSCNTTLVSEVEDCSLPLPSAIFYKSKPSSKTSPRSRKPAPIFKFRLPQPEPCTNPHCAQDEQQTVNRCNMCNTPAHAACLNDRLYCTPCYNQHMNLHKQKMAEKRKAAKALKQGTKVVEPKKKQKVMSVPHVQTPQTSQPNKKPKMSSGLTKSSSTQQSCKSLFSKSVQQNVLVNQVPTLSEKSTQRPESALERAERRQLEEAIALSKVDAAPPTPVKDPSPGDYSRMLKNSLVVSPHTEKIIDVGHLPSLEEKDITVLDADELSKLKEVKKSHFNFMMGRVNSPLVSHLLGAANLGLVDGFCLSSNIRAATINENFRVYDLMSLLSFRPVSDAVLTCYLHWLQSTTQNVYFANPSLFRYMEVFDNSAERVLGVSDWVHYNYVCFPININDWHWTLAVFRVEEKPTIFYIDSLNESKEQVRASIPNKLVEKLTIFGRSGCIESFQPDIEVLMVPRQKKGNNDCGMCVNEMCKTFARDPEEFLRGNAELMFDTTILRCTQANTLLKWLYHDPCNDEANP